MIPEGWQVRGDGLAVLLDNRVTANNGDGVLSTPMLPGPFLVVSVWLFRTGSLPGSCQVSIVDAPVRQEAVVDVKIPIIGDQLFPVGPDLALFAGPGEQVAIGPSQGALDALTAWPWYFHPRRGALALWVRKHTVLAGSAGFQAGVSVWPLERTDRERELRERAEALGMIPPLVVQRRGERTYAAPHAATFNGRR